MHKGLALRIHVLHFRDHSLYILLYYIELLAKYAPVWQDLQNHVDSMPTEPSAIQLGKFMEAFLTSMFYLPQTEINDVLGKNPMIVFIKWNMFI